MENFSEEHLREFLLAVRASGSRPSPNFFRAVGQISDVDELRVKALVNEIFGEIEAATADQLF